jgi:hypothetical protein
MDALLRHGRRLLKDEDGFRMAIGRLEFEVAEEG